jgi:hypothetical protein
MQPVWEAVRFEAVLKAGRTRPILLECQQRSRGSTRRERFVTKAIGLPEVHDFTLCHEFVGASLARLAGLAAPQPALVSISEEFLEATQPDLERERVRPSAGLGVGSMFVPHMQPFPASANLLEAEVVDAARVYAFDLLVQNADRRAASPNCGRASGRIVPYDFEGAFGFRFALSRREPWRVSALGFASQHLFHSELRQSVLDWPEILSSFVPLTRASLAELCGTLPSDWTAIGADVQAHIEAVLTHWPQFSDEVAATLGDHR